MGAIPMKVTEDPIKIELLPSPTGSGKKSATKNMAVNVGKKMTHSSRFEQTEEIELDVWNKKLKTTDEPPSDNSNNLKISSLGPQNSSIHEVMPPKSK